MFSFKKLGNFIIPVLLYFYCINYCFAGHLTPEGEDKKALTKTLDLGATLLQTHAPLKNFDVYLVAFHPHKDDPQVQMEAHHFCNNMNEDFMQCVLFDDNTKDANLNGIEYIISEKLYNKLPQEEKQYWHPHNYEILSGQLIAPRLPDKVEKTLLKKKINSYGKTWHLWHTKNNKDNGDNLPLGEPMLAWSFNHDEELDEKLLENRDNKFKVNTYSKRQNRQDLIPFANPQNGVNLLKDQYNMDVIPIPGVKDIND